MTVMPRFLTGTPGLIAAFAAAALCGASAAVSAEGLPAADEGSRWSLSGFGTLGAVWHDEDDTQFRRSVDQHRGTRANELDFGIDSTLGVQVHGALTPQWSLMAQAVMNQGRHGEWGPHLVWGFVKYVPSDGLELRAGRLVTDIYFDGDSRHVGYAYTAVRPYADVYGRLTYDNFDGLDATVQHALGEGLLRFKLFGGRTRGSVFLNEREHPLRIGRTFGATLDWIGPELSLKLSWGNMVSTRNGIYSPLRPVLQGVAQGAQALGDHRLAAQASSLASEIIDSNRIGYLGAALAWERGPLSLQFMGTDMSMTVFPGFEGWGAGATAAYRMGRWKPYVTWSRSILDPKDRPLDLDRPIPQELPPPLAGYPVAVGYLRGLYPTITGYTRHDQTTMGAGVRYDFADNVALKLQLDRIDAKRSSSLLDDRGYVTGPRALTVFSATLDFVF
jgi:opacity protein-like surface antigen